jgi:hypothetical protein
MYRSALIFLVISVISSLVNASTPDLTFEEAIKHAAALAGDWSSQQALLHEIADRIKPETIPNIEHLEVETNATDRNAEGVMDKEILNQIWMDIEPLRPSFDNPMLFGNTSLSAGRN